MFVGWGSAAAYTEFAADGEILCDVHFGAESVFGSGRISSYRAFKSEWVGRPVTPPNIKMVKDDVYVRWNGATEVVAWELQGAKCLGDGDETFETFDYVQKEGFETNLQLPEDKDDYAYLRAAALDRSGQALGHTDVIDTATKRERDASTTARRSTVLDMDLAVYCLLRSCHCWTKYQAVLGRFAP